MRNEGEPEKVLLDTCAVIFLRSGRLSPASLDMLAGAGARGGVHVSPVSAWEIGLLARSTRRGLAFEPDAPGWWRGVLDLPGVRLLPLSPASAIASSFLPEPLHSDPADRLLIAAARDASMPLVTSDRRILDYAAVGHLTAIAC